MDGRWRLRRDSPERPTHLMLDGGKLRVPSEDAGAFLAEYAVAVAQGRKPSIVEMRTPVFKLFLDLDIKTAGGAPLDVSALMDALQACAAHFFDQAAPRAVVCSTQPSRYEGCKGTCVKDGKHVVWPGIIVAAPTALAFREKVVAALEERMPGACVEPWDVVVDDRVFKSNGLRMPFSLKGPGGGSVYAPCAVWEGANCEAVDDHWDVKAVRRWVRELSIRCFGVEETPVRDGMAIVEHASEGAVGTTQCLQPYRGVLKLLEGALPPHFDGQRFTGLVRAEACFLIRSSSRKCLNLEEGRQHNSSSVYFILTPWGVRQGCYCRKKTTEGRLYGLCEDFKSEAWPVPPEVVEAFFGASSESVPGAAAGPESLIKTAALPSQISRRQLDTLHTRTNRGGVHKPRGTRKKPAGKALKAVRA